MGIKVRTQNTDNDTVALPGDTSVSVVIDSERDMRDAWSQKDFQTWLYAFRNRYAETLEYLRDH